ncbi:fluoride efflux transporter FluC [Chloroflexota bacterium]
MRQLMYLAIAGGLGTLSRYALSGLAQRITGTGFPCGTLLTNILGCLAIGCVMQVALNTDVIPATFSYETVKFLEDSAFVSAMLNIASNVGIGLLATFFGMFLGRITVGGV